MPLGVQLLGVHTPETEAERVLDNVKKKVKELGLQHPILIDGKGENWQRWSQQYWPSVYLVDKRGKVRYRWQGELEFKEQGGERRVGALIHRLLREA